MTIGVIGESLVDVVTDASGVTIERPGGSPFNVAIGLARLRMPTRLFTAMGDDARGQRLLALLADEGIEVSRGESTATSVATATVDGAGNATYSFDLTWDPRFADDWPPLDALHFGSIGAVMFPGAAEVSAAIDRYAGSALITFDPNWREGIVDANPREVVEANAARADVVKLSEDDAAAIYPSADFEDVARTLLDVGPALVVITRGAAGASAWTRNVVKHCLGAPAEVVDTLGAGDAFMATLLSELSELNRDKVAKLNKRELELVLDFASYYAARTCERAGADPPRLEDLDEV
jgi:fructokinase